LAGSRHRREQDWRTSGSSEGPELDRVQVHEVAKPALADCIDPAMPVDQHQHAIAAAFRAAKISQVDRVGAVEGPTLSRLRSTG